MSKRFLALVCFFTLYFCSSLTIAQSFAEFNWFRYSGHDDVFEKNIDSNQYRNPIIAGFHPDPSITRAGDNYYLVNSSFGYFPGLPIFKSSDLVNWQALGHVLTRPSQLQLKGAGVSEGIFAPTIRYHKGVFYVITTNVSGGGNFIVTANHAEGPWSDPIYLPEIKGIDPSIFFDDDGKVYITHNGEPQGQALYAGHRAIWIWQFDLEKMSVVADSGRVIVNGGVDIKQEPIWIEGPHIYKKDNWYYLLCAEGGTGDQHSEVVFRTKSLDEPFTPYENNPILTQRTLPKSRKNPVSAAGHADLIETSSGEWWAVFLATRNYNEKHFNTGRETFLLPVVWRDNWPHILEQGRAIPYTHIKPKALKPTKGASLSSGNFTWQDEFDSFNLAPQWNFLRTPEQRIYQLKASGGLQLFAGAKSLSSKGSANFVARRQQHMSFEASTELALIQPELMRAGLVIFQNEGAYYSMMVQTFKNNRIEVELSKVDKPIQKVVLESRGKQALQLRILGEQDKLSFYFRFNPQQTWTLLQDNIDAELLSTTNAGGFVGTYIGLFAQTLTDLN